MNVEPIVNLPVPLYISGLNISVASTTVVAIAPGQARDSSDQIDMPVGYPNYSGGIAPAPSFLNCPQPIFINTGIIGANGLDAGVLVASTNYIIYLIADSRNFKPVAGLMSVYSNQYPLLPSGYDSYRILGYVSADGSTHLTQATVLNARYAKDYFLQPSVSVLSGGNSTTYATIDLSSAIPTTTDPFVIAYINVIFTPAAAGDIVQIRPLGFGSLATGVVTIVGQQAGIAQTECVAVMTAVGSSKPEIQYLVTAAGDAVSMLVEGYSVTLA